METEVTTEVSKLVSIELTTRSVVMSDVNCSDIVVGTIVVMKEVCTLVIVSCGRVKLETIVVG